MRVVEIPFGSVGIDCLSPIAPAVAKEIAAYRLPGTRTGITFVERYLENLTVGELDGLFAADLGVAFVGEGRVSGWDAATGLVDAERELGRAQLLKLPAGSSPLLTIGCDLEGMVNCTPQNATAYGMAWGNRIARAAFASEGYIGDGVPLSPIELYHLPFVGYWRSLSNVQQIAVADFAKFQGYPTQTLHLASGPFEVDCNFVVRDKKLRLPKMVVGA
jgi:hypothetical protein